MAAKTPVAHPVHSAQHHASRFTSKQRTIALVIVAMAFVMDLLDNTIVNIAIPSIQANLGASFAAIQWLSAGYALAFALLLITGGRMGDVFGYKKLFLIGVVGFTAASLLCGFAWNTEVLVGGRLVQGVMAALMVPQVMSLMQVMYGPKERATVMGIFGGMAGLAASLGPIIGGFLIQWNIFGLDWRPIFLINIPIGVIVFLGAMKYLPEGKSPHPLKLDGIGTVLIVAALGMLIFPLIQGRELDWPIWTFAMMALSLPVLALFWWWQHKKQSIDNSPLIIPSLFKKKSFVVGVIANIAFEMLMLGFFFTITLLLQLGFGFSVVEAALTGLPTAVGITFSVAFLTQKMLPKFGRYTMTFGTVVLALGLLVTFWTVHYFGSGTSAWEFVPGYLIIGTGLGMIMGLLFSATLKDVDPEHAGSASGTLSAIQQLGAAMGIAIVGVVFFGQLSSNASMSFETVAPQIRSELTAQNIPAEAQISIIEGARTCFVDRNNAKDVSDVPESCRAHKDVENTHVMPESVGKTTEAAAKEANARNFIRSFDAVIYYSLVLSVVLFGLSFAFPRYLDGDTSAH